jgi:hypothetical protein
MDLKTAKGETNPESLNGDTLQANLIMPEPCHFDDLTVQAQEVEPHQEHVLRPAQGVPEVFDVFANYLLQK